MGTLHKSYIMNRQSRVGDYKYRFRGYGAPGGRKSPFSIDFRNGPYNSVRTNVLHCNVVSRPIHSKTNRCKKGVKTYFTPYKV